MEYSAYLLILTLLMIYFALMSKIIGNNNDRTVLVNLTVIIAILIMVEIIRTITEINQIYYMISNQLTQYLNYTSVNNSLIKIKN